MKKNNNIEPLVEIGTGDIKDCWTGSKVGTYKNAKNVWFDVRPLKRFLHRKYKHAKFLEGNDDNFDYSMEETEDKNEETEEYDYWSEKPTVKVDGEENNLTDNFGWRNNIESVDMFGCKEVYSLSLTFNIERSQPQRLILESTLNTNKSKGKNKESMFVTLKLKKDKNKKLYFECDGKKIENLKVWLGKPWTIINECYIGKSGDLDNLNLDKRKCVEFSLQNVTQNIKQLNSSFDKKNSDELTIYYFVETEDFNGKYEFDSCETISLSKDKIGDEDVKLGYISVHNGQSVETKKIKMFIASENCKKFDFEEKNSTSNEQMNLLRENGFVELDVKRGTDKKNDRYCVMYGKNRVDKTEITQFDYTQMWSNNSSNKINDINKHKSNSKNSKVEEKLTPREKLTFNSGYESESEKVSIDLKNFKSECECEKFLTYTGTNEDSERERQAIKNYLDESVDSQIWYANPNVVKNLNYKACGTGNLEEKACIIISVSELCNSWVYRYENNDKNLWFFQRWYAKFALLFGIGKVAKIFKWYPTKHSYENHSYTKQIKSGFSDSSDENDKIKNENEKGNENEDMAAPPGYNENSLGQR